MFLFFRTRLIAASVQSDKAQAKERGVNDNTGGGEADEWSGQEVDFARGCARVHGIEAAEAEAILEKRRKGGKIL